MFEIVIVITFYSPSCLSQETAKGPFGFESSYHLPTVYNTRQRLHIVPLIAERQAEKLRMNRNGHFRIPNSEESETQTIRNPN